MALLQLAQRMWVVLMWVSALVQVLVQDVAWLQLPQQPPIVVVVVAGQAV